MRSLLLLLLPVLLAGCGYQLSGGRLPADVERIYVPLAANMTSEPLIENLLAGPLTAVLARQQGVHLVSEGAAEATLHGQIARYEVKPISYASNDRISQFQATLQIHFSLIKIATGQLLWQGDLVRQQNYLAAVDKNEQEDLEAEALEALVQQIADDLVYRLVTRF